MFGPKQMALELMMNQAKQGAYDTATQSRLELEAARFIRLAAKIRHALDQMADDALESITP